MLDDLERSALEAIQRLTEDTYRPTDGEAVAQELARQGRRPEDDMTVNHLLRRLKADGYISPRAYFGADGLRSLVSIDLTPQGREIIAAAAVEASPGALDGGQPDPRNVMVVHGRDEKAREQMFGFLRALHLVPLEWGDLVAATGSAAPYLGQVLATAFETAKAVVVLFTPDDEAWLRAELRHADDPPAEIQPTPQARPNVLFEAGMALGLHPDRTVLVELGKLRPFSDIYGRHVVRLDPAGAKLQEISRRLADAGCPVDDSEIDWDGFSFPDRSATSSSNAPPRAASPGERRRPGARASQANSLVGRFRIRQFATPLENDEAGVVFRVVLSTHAEAAIDEFNSDAKAAVVKALSESSLELWGRSVSCLVSPSTPEGNWTPARPNSGYVATFSRDWGTSATQDALLSSRATVQLTGGIQFGTEPKLTLDVIQRPADAHPTTSQRAFSGSLVMDVGEVRVGV